MPCDPARDSVQERGAPGDTCAQRFRGLNVACSAAAALVATPEHASPRSFGREPAFNPASGLYSAAAHGNEGAYYNTSAAAGEVDARTLYPHAYVLDPGAPMGEQLPVFLPVRLRLGFISFSLCFVLSLFFIHPHRNDETGTSLSAVQLRGRSPLLRGRR